MGVLKSRSNAIEEENMEFNNFTFGKDWYATRVGGGPRRCTLPVSLNASAKNTLGSGARRLMERRKKEVQIDRKLSNAFWEIFKK